ncbi:MAG: DedA family protein [Nitrospira sp.]|nr:DedA family protein [Nitrospira sp.]
MLFVVVLVEQIGFPVPALLFLIAAGALVGTGQMALGLAFGSAVLAALLGDQVWYELGRRCGRQVLNWLCRISLEPTACVRRTEEFFTRYGARSLFVVKFIPGFSTTLLRWLELWASGCRNTSCITARGRSCGWVQELGSGTPSAINSSKRYPWSLI